MTAVTDAGFVEMRLAKVVGIALAGEEKSGTPMWCWRECRRTGTCPS
jgi:hypothetical protein